MNRRSAAMIMMRRWMKREMPRHKFMEFREVIRKEFACREKLAGCSCGKTCYHILPLNLQSAQFLICFRTCIK